MARVSANVPIDPYVVESLRGPKETSWSWDTRKKFILYHLAHSSLRLDMINCYAWTLVNSRTLGCRYDQEHIAQLNLMAVEADIEQDLEMGGPTPQIVSNVATSNSRRGRGRGGHSNGTRPIPSENGNVVSGFPSSIHAAVPQQSPAGYRRQEPVAPVESAHASSGHLPVRANGSSASVLIPRPLQILSRQSAVMPPHPVSSALPLIPPIQPLAAFISPQHQLPPRIEPRLLPVVNAICVEDLEAEMMRLSAMSLNEVEGPREVKRDLPKQEPFVAKAPDSTPPVGAQKNFPVPNEITRSCLYDQTASCSLSRQKTELSVETRNGFQHTIKVLPLKCSNGGQRPNGRATAGCSKSVLKGTRTVSADGWTFLRTRPRHEIIVRQCGELIEKNASRILHETIDANKASKLIQFNAGVAPDSKSNGPPLNTVTIQYASYSLCSSLAISAKDAKNRASLECLKAFVEYFAVVKISAADATFVQSISHADFLSGAAIDQILCQVESPVCWKPNVHANFGYKIMHRFGWREGRGLGLRENGMIYAISTSAAQIGYNSGYGRPGLGFRDSSDQALIADRCEELCRIFLANAVLLEDMVFSSDFTLQEREVLHSVAEKYGLSHNSVGSGENRHIVIRYKWPSLSKLVEELRRVGGKTGRYELVEPQ